MLKDRCRWLEIRTVDQRAEHITQRFRRQIDTPATVAEQCRQLLLHKTCPQLRRHERSRGRCCAAPPTEFQYQRHVSRPRLDNLKQPSVEPNPIALLPDRGVTSEDAE